MADQIRQIEAGIALIKLRSKSNEGIGCVMYFRSFSAIASRSAFLHGHRALRLAPRPISRGRTRMPPQSMFGFGKKSLRTDSESAGMVGSQKRDDYGYDDVEQYFNYMGMLAEDGTYDRMQAYLDSGLHPIDILLLWASAEGDDPKVQELLDAGASVEAKDMKGNTPLDLAGNDRVRELLSNA